MKKGILIALLSLGCLGVKAQSTDTLLVTEQQYYMMATMTREQIRLLNLNEHDAVKLRSANRRLVLMLTRREVELMARIARLEQEVERLKSREDG
jgi:hypothetical protein